MTENINTDLLPLARPISWFKLDPNNARRHGEHSVDAIMTSLTDHGQQKNVVCVDDGTVVAGNGMLMAATALNWTRLAAVTFPDREKAEAYALADNRTAEHSEWDPEALSNALKRQIDTGANLKRLGFDDGFLKRTLVEPHQRLRINLPPPPADPDPPEEREIPTGKREWSIHVGDCLEVLRTMEANTFDACVTDPPYELALMGKQWDASGIAFNVDVWRQVLRVLKPGAHLVAFGGTRTSHRMVCAIEDAGFEIRDGMQWLHGQGFPKSLDVSKLLRANADDPEQGVMAGVADDLRVLAERWEGWGTALKPGVEPICLARKTLDGTLIRNLERYGVGLLNVDACRIGDELVSAAAAGGLNKTTPNAPYDPAYENDVTGRFGRWPANVLLDEFAAALLDAQTGDLSSGEPGNRNAVATSVAMGASSNLGPQVGYGDTGGASRFFYCAKPSRTERDWGLDDLPTMAGANAVGRKEGSAGTQSPRAGAGRNTKEVRNVHPTVKPVDLMRYLVTLVTPQGGRVLDPFFGSGTTGLGCSITGNPITGIELETPHATIAEHRLKAWAKHTENGRMPPV